VKSWLNFGTFGLRLGVRLVHMLLASNNIVADVCTLQDALWLNLICYLYVFTRKRNRSNIKIINTKCNITLLIVMIIQ